MGRLHQDFNVEVPDPRLAIIDERLGGVKRIIVVASGKGGVGKSLIATTLSLLLARDGKKVGLLDLDFHGPSCHIILGATDAVPAEEMGLIPPVVQGVKFMSLVYYIGDRPLPLRGEEASNVFVELLTITRWGQLDYLVVDVPPGIAEEVLDIIRLIKRGEFLVVTTPSKLAVKTVARLVQLLQELKVPTLGLVENMHPPSSKIGKTGTFKANFLGRLPFDPEVEKTLGHPEELLKTHFARSLKRIVKKLGR
ncbi:MAG: Mrp/NBP35 family ATP-binding protein [Candidatus Hadarchaeum sp.]|uniref:Mrp/NBP35 family ATP-binding protein n=1 Tax=Candidatus Hadarchaeum sp. TaxID=2883567 RepID=UPI00317FF7FE